MASVNNNFSPPPSGSYDNLFDLKRSRWSIDGVPVTATAAQLNSGGGSLPGFNGVQIYLSQETGDDTFGDGSEFNPFATFNRAITFAGTPIIPTQIIALDGAIYDEQLTINSSLIWINSPLARIGYTGVGDAIIITSSGAGFPIIIGEINATSGNALTNQNNEIVILRTGSLLGGHIVNQGSGFISISAELVAVNFTNTGGGTIYYTIGTRLAGTDSANVLGTSVNSASSTWTVASDINSRTGRIQALQGNVEAGSNGNIGQLLAFPSTANTGFVNIRAQDNLANVSTEITNQPNNIAVTYTLPQVPFSNVTFQCSTVPTTDPGANLVCYDSDTSFTLLAGGASVPIANTYYGGQYRVREMYINAGTTNFSGGDRDLRVTDGVTDYSIIPASTLMALSNARWGSAMFPFPASAPINTLTWISGVDLSITYVNGTTDYTSGDLSITVMWEKIN